MISGGAEIVASAFGITSLRAKYVRFLPPMGADFYTLVIASNQNPELESWLTFIKPLSWELWIVLSVVSVVTATWLHLTNYGTTLEMVKSRH